jgi:putative hydrolase of the HAD superfamily
MIEAISFDFFQTLAHHHGGNGGRGRALMDYLTSQGLEPMPWEHQALYDILEPHAREYAPGHTPEQKQAYRERVAARVFDRLGLSHTHDEPNRHAGAIWERIGPRSLRIYPDVMPALRDLQSAGYRLIITSNWQCGLAHFCTELGIGEYFELVCASAEIGSEKPDGAIFAEAARRLALPPDRILHVGDSPVDDIEGARRAGMRAVLIDRDGVSPATAGAIRRLDEVTDRLERWSA